MKLPIALLLALAFPVCGISAALAADDTDEPPAWEWSAKDASNDFTLFAEDDILDVYDPLEPINRGIFWFNDKAYFYALKPVAKAYRILPEDLRVSVKNFFLNLQAPIRIINAGLQGKFTITGNELTRFAINTTLGIGGFFDPAREHFDLRLHDEDTGQTFGHYGIGPGPYLVLPLLGPSSLRDGIGRIGDTYLDLAWHIWGKDAGDNNYDYIGARVLDTINDVSLDKDTYEAIKRDALDPYLFIRDAHAQMRRNLVDN